MNSLGSKDAWTFCQGILPDVSRSFALIIPKCPPPIDRALCVAYLLCRVADTVEDEPGLDPQHRGELYDQFLTVMNAPESLPLIEAFKSTWRLTDKTPAPDAGEGAYARLIDGLAAVMAAYCSLPEWCRKPIRGCVHEMVAGMRVSLPVEQQHGIAFYCRDLADLDQYCHYVAGTVGVMSTALFEWYFSGCSDESVGAVARSDTERVARSGAVRDSGRRQAVAGGTWASTPEWREDGRRMGLGLQMTNIVKDCRVDAERGVSFIPSRYVIFAGKSYDLTSAGRAELIGHTVGHLDAAMRYIAAIPADQKGIRTFLLGSVFPAIATLEIAAAGRQYHPKISRLKMGQIFTAITRKVGDQAALNGWYQRHRERTLAQLG